MKLAFTVDPDDDILKLIDEHSDPQRPLASVIYQLSRPNGTGETFLTREYQDEDGYTRTVSKTFKAGEYEILSNHLKSLLEFLNTQD